MMIFPKFKLKISYEHIFVLDITSGISSVTKYNIKGRLLWTLLDTELYTVIGEYMYFDSLNLTPSTDSTFLYFFV